MSKVFLALQLSDDSRSIVDAILADCHTGRAAGDGEDRLRRQAYPQARFS